MSRAVKTLSYVARANAYARGVVSGKIDACRYVKLACGRHLDGLSRAKQKGYPYRLDSAAATKVCRFVELLPHVKGKWARDRERIRLEPWQCFILVNVFGWLRKADGLRRYRRAYIEVARKNAKSTLTAAVGLYMLCADGEHGAEVYCGAGTEKQAWEVFGPARQMALNTPALRQAYGLDVGARNMAIEATASKFEPIIGKPGDGASPSFSITDEYHEHATSEQFDTMETGMGAREQPIAWVITTAGSDTAGPCYALRQQAVETLEGQVERDTMFAIIYTLDVAPEGSNKPGDNWADPKVLPRANPNYGISVFEDFLLNGLQSALNDPREQAKYKTKHGNIWVTSSFPYFNIEKWNRLADHSLNIDDFKRQPCFIGLDTASKLDIASTVLVFPREEKGEMHYYVFGRHYLPKATAEKPENRHYQGWVEDRHIIVSGTEKTDYRQLRDDIIGDFQKFDVVEMGYDPYNAAELSADLVDQFGSEKVVEVLQTMQQLSEPMKELRALIESGCVHHDGNLAMAWMIANVVAREDRSENVAPEKERSEKKIDGAVAAIIALGEAMRHEPQPAPQILGFRDAPENPEPDAFEEDPVWW